MTDKHIGKDTSTGATILDAIKQTMDALAGDEQHKDAVLALEKVVAKKKKKSQPKSIRRSLSVLATGGSPWTSGARTRRTRLQS